MKNKFLRLSLIFSSIFVLFLSFIPRIHAAELGNEIFCQPKESAFLAKSFSPEQLYTCHLTASKISVGETLDLDIVLAGSLQLVSVENPSFCTQIPRPGVGMTVECANNGKGLPIEDIDLLMTINSSTGPEGSIAVSGHLKDDLNTLGTTKFTPEFNTSTENPLLNGNALLTDVTNASEAESTLPLPLIIVLILAAFGIIIGLFIAFRKPSVPLPVTTPEMAVHQQPQPPVPPTPPTSSSPSDPIIKV